MTWWQQLLVWFSGFTVGAGFMNVVWQRLIARKAEGLRAEMKPDMDRMTWERERYERMLAVAVAACRPCKARLGGEFNKERRS